MFFIPILKTLRQSIIEQMIWSLTLTLQEIKRIIVSLSAHHLPLQQFCILIKTSMLVMLLTSSQYLPDIYSVLSYRLM